MSNAFSETDMWTNSFYDDSPFQFVQLLWKIYVQFLSATLSHLILLFRKMSQYIQFGACCINCMGFFVVSFLCCLHFCVY